MDICASNGLRSEQILESIGSGAKLSQDVVVIATADGELVNEVIVQTEGEVIQEFIVPNSSISTSVKPLVAAPRMPQQSAPRNTTQEEAAGVPSSVTTPTFTIPPHLMGRNVDNPTEDMIGSGRKLQKPRLGVRVPYRNLTSQIVTQDEIAQELLERSLKKHPVHDTPEGGDLFFAMKLTQRLANRLSPSTAVTSGISGSEIDTIAGKSGHFQQNTDANCILPPGYTLVPESTAIPDHGELLAILEGDADPDWMPDANPPTLDEVVKPSSIAEASRPPTLVEAGSSIGHISVHTTPPKLDPLIEREMALKQLMELPIRSKKKKNTDTQTKGIKSPQKPRERGKKEPQSQSSAKKANANSISVQINSQDSENNNKAAINGNSKVETDTKQKQTRKRKLTDTGDAKKPNMAKKKKTDVSESKSVVVVGNSKTDTPVKKTKPTRATGTKKQTTSKNQSPLLNNGTAGVTTKRKKISLPNSSGSKSTPSSTDLVNKSLPGASSQSSQDSVKNSAVTDGNSDDEFPQPVLNSKKFATPPRTYSPRKRIIKPEDGVAPARKENVVAAILVKEIGITLSECTQNSSPKPEAGPKSNTSSSKLDNSLHSKSNESLSKATGSITPKSITFTTPKQTSSSKSVGNVNAKSVETSSSKSTGSASVKETGHVRTPSSVSTPQSPKKHMNISNSAQSNSDAKKKRLREVERLLMDEGAINLLYEVEQGESKRRSGPSEGVSSSPKRKVRSPLKSVRRQKKDLLLKTRLVKNAVLRLSSLTPSASTAVALRARRQIGPPTLQLATSQNQYKSLQRKKSLDSRESLRSPPPLTPVDPPSPSQTFSFPPRLHLPAEASRIIRRHSSSSTFSSRSTSPNLQHRNSIDSIQSPENSENKPDNHHGKIGSSASVASSSKSSSVFSDKKRAEVRKKGVPIFVRKAESTQTYKGKKKKDNKQVPTNNNVAVSRLSESAERLLEIKCKELKIHPKTHADMKKTGNVETKKRVPVTAAQTNTHKKMSTAVKMKIKSQMTKNFQKGFQKAKPLKLKKSIPESKIKKKEGKTGDKTDPLDVEMPDLTSCLAAVASEFAAEGESLKKAAQLRRGSHDSSPCSSQGSKSPSNQQPPLLKKETRDVPPPLSPNASSYSTLIKTLETESQKQKKKEEEGTKQRSSVRQNAGTYHYKEICLRRYDNLVQIILTPASTKMKNSLNIQVLRELREALNQLKRDEGCRVVLLTSAGSSFCQGIDFHGLLHTNADKRKTAAQELAQALKEFLKSLALFSKPLVAGVHGAAVGLGVTMLPFFDMVFASDKATFYTPYAKLGQVPEGAAILTLPHMLGNAVTSELLFGCRKLTASEALHFGLVTRILWPDRFQEELIPIIRSMASQSAQSMEATKALLRHSLRAKLEAALDSEVPLLVQHWISAECQANFRRFLDDEDVGLQRQRLDP
ncbi:serine-rich adhesin for platelets [Periplaneta americana]|uniref:serine-rich adhesin for platelets n=1 Tax=Periplaneta americana TaxID=6978 RepID=UPI0037E9C5B3